MIDSPKYGLCDIQLHPTVVKTIAGQEHESLYRAWHILRVVEELLEDGVPGPAVAKIVRELHGLPQKEAGGEGGRG